MDFHHHQLNVFFSLLLVLLLSSSITEAKNNEIKIFNVMKYGAVADGRTDNYKAFTNAWNDACKWRGNSRFLVPKSGRTNSYRTSAVTFLGPCNGGITFLLKGVIKAPTGKSSLNTDHWITFRYLDRFTLAGGGVFDGEGASAWPYNNCNTTTKCIQLPVSLRFDFVTNSRIHHITSINSKNFHMNIFGSKNLLINNIRISAPSESPNTDGIHIGKSSEIQIKNSVIATGDDCISMSHGSVNIDILNVKCGPGHGISVGSLGSGPNEEPVTGLRVKNCTFKDTDNGLRIKTWAPSKPGNVFNLTFEDIVMDNVRNPIIIDQQYCPSRTCDVKAASQVEINDVKFRNIRGISMSKIAVNLQCSSKKPCRKIELRDINLAYNNNDGPALSSCSHVNGGSYGQQHPPSCLR